jgi:hypothetical protein
LIPFYIYFMLCFLGYQGLNRHGCLSLNLGVDVLHERIPLHQHVSEGGAREDSHHLNTGWSDWSHMTFWICAHWMLKILTTRTPGWSDWSHMTFWGCSHWLLKILDSHHLNTGWSEMESHDLLRLLSLVAKDSHHQDTDWSEEITWSFEPCSFTLVDKDSRHNHTNLSDTLIKKKIKLSSYIRKLRVEQLQSHRWGRSS